MAQGPPDDAVTLASSELAAMSGNERIKLESKGLFFVADPKGSHTFRDEVEALERGSAPTLTNTGKELSKFFGIYKQQVRGERGKKTHEYIFMVRIKNPAGGRLTTRQWLALDDAAERFADGTLRITSRQGIQYHRVTGPQLAPLIRHLNRGYRSSATLGACGDVNRNVMCSPIDELDPEHAPGGLALAHAIAEELAPRTSAYFEVFLSDEEGRSGSPVNPTEPIYGEQYLPRKFKIGFAHPTDNSVDVRTNDIGFVPADAAGARWDVWSGGGLGLTHNNPRTAALLAEWIGRVPRDQVVATARAIVLLQREHGERGDRKQARWKYTLRRLGLPAVRAALRERFGLALEDAEPVTLPPMRLHLGWHAQRGGGHYYGLSVENGRLKGAQRRAVREAVERLGLSVVLTPQQDLILCDVKERAALEAILDTHGVTRPERVSRVRANAMACPAKPTCGLAMTDAENVLPGYIDAIEAAGLGDVDVVIRMTGCPNNCARPPSAEIGIYGYGKNDHVVLVGGSRNGDRLAHALYARISEEKMVPALIGVLRAVRERNPEGLPAGDFLHRSDPAELRRWAGVEDGA
jgi:sulfite reductase (ferredoxin)